VAGSIAGKTINVIDAHDQHDCVDARHGPRRPPDDFNWNPDGSTKWIFVQLSGFNGFAVVDFATKKELRRIANPELPPGKPPFRKAPILRMAWRSPPTARRSSSAAA
jgi:hypothetical protein